MHETGIVRDLLRAAERAAGGPTETITALTVRVGPLSGFSVQSVRRHIEELAERRWERRPEVVVEMAGLLTDPGAAGVTLLSIRVEP